MSLITDVLQRRVALERQGWMFELVRKGDEVSCYAWRSREDGMGGIVQTSHFVKRIDDGSMRLPPHIAVLLNVCADAEHWDSEVRA